MEPKIRPNIPPFVILLDAAVIMAVTELVTCTISQ